MGSKAVTAMGTTSESHHVSIQVMTPTEKMALGEFTNDILTQPRQKRTGPSKRKKWCLLIALKYIKYRLCKLAKCEKYFCCFLLQSINQINESNNELYSGGMGYNYVLGTREEENCFEP
jgi:hypothetical protein